MDVGLDLATRQRAHSSDRPRHTRSQAVSLPREMAGATKRAQVRPPAGLRRCDSGSSRACECRPGTRGSFPCEGARDRGPPARDDLHPLAISLLVSRGGNGVGADGGTVPTVKDVLTAVSSQLGNTRAVCKTSYIQLTHRPKFVGRHLRSLSITTQLAKNQADSSISDESFFRHTIGNCFTSFLFCANSFVTIPTRIGLFLRCRLF